MGAFLLGVVAWLSRVGGWRRYAPVGGVAGGTEREERLERHKPAGLTRWLTTVDHKDIGLLYGAFALFSFAVGGLMVTVMRLELVDPPATLVSASTYNSLLTSHGITMLFLFGTPIIAAFA
ncbi:MAG: cbb3-type cytochrome c oxidase subunit I, partial [Haloferacaceae archaeon]